MQSSRRRHGRLLPPHDTRAIAVGPPAATGRWLVWRPVLQRTGRSASQHFPSPRLSGALSVVVTGG